MTAPMTIPSVDTSDADLRDVQGGLIGFNKDHQRLIFFDFQDLSSARLMLQELQPSLTSGWEVLRFNELYGEIHRERGNPTGLDIIQAQWINIWISRAGIELLAPADVPTFPEDFSQGMAARKSLIGDSGASEPSNWIGATANGATPHAVIVIAADTRPGRDAATDRVLAVLQRYGVSPLEVQDGDVRPDAARGQEHFGFKDGISQPGITGFTTSGKTGSGSVAPGEFLIGHPDEDENISGEPAATPALPVQSGYQATVPVGPLGLPSWARNGSFVAYRRLRQDVAAFRAFLQRASEWGLNPDQLAAKMVGRWPSGAPMEQHALGGASDVDPSLTDPSVAFPAVLADSTVNDFTFDADAEGVKVPRAAHIRKMNPRSEQLPGGDKASRHRMLRRGIPYGPDFVEAEPAYMQTVLPAQDRGLLFICYQASLSRTFETVQGAWANKPDFPQTADGEDPMTSQDLAMRPFHLRAPQDVHLLISQWVTTTGGGYFFSPSLTAILNLSASPGS